MSVRWHRDAFMIKLRSQSGLVLVNLAYVHDSIQIMETAQPITETKTLTTVQASLLVMVENVERTILMMPKTKRMVITAFRHLVKKSSSVWRRAR